MPPEGAAMAEDHVEQGPVDPLSGEPEWALSRRERRRAERARQGLPPPRRKWPWVLLVLLIGAGAGAWTQREAIAERLAAAQVPEAPVAEEPEAPALLQIERSEWTALEPR